MCAAAACSLPHPSLHAVAGPSLASLPCLLPLPPRLPQQVLQNPATQLQESPNVDMEALTAKNIKPFTCAVDVWAAGVLAYELVCGRPPFEVEDEVKTVTKILYCNNIRFPTPIPSGFSLHWSDFVRCALIKDPMRRPDAKGLLQHPW